MITAVAGNDSRLASQTRYNSRASEPHTSKKKTETSTRNTAQPTKRELPRDSQESTRQLPTMRLHYHPAQRRKSAADK